MDTEERKRLRLEGPDGDPDCQEMWSWLLRARWAVRVELGFAQMLGRVDNRRAGSVRRAERSTPLDYDRPQLSCPSWERLLAGVNGDTGWAAKEQRRLLRLNAKRASTWVSRVRSLFTWLDDNGYTLAKDGKNTGCMRSMAAAERKTAVDSILRANEAAQRIVARLDKLDALYKLGALPAVKFAEARNP